MSIKYWVAIVAVLVCFLIYWKLHKYSKKLESSPAMRGILEQPGNCSFISPMAVHAIDDIDVDLNKIKKEALDRVVRLRMVEIFEAVNDPSKKIKDEDDIKNLKRIATVHAAYHGQTIHNSLILMDHMTKALLCGVQHRMELVLYTMDDIPWRAVRHNDKFKLRHIGGLDYSVKQEFLTMMGKNDYDYFHNFATRVRRRIRRSRHENYSDEEIQSAITAYAARLGFMIPRSYVRIDEITSLLVHWDSEETSASNVISITRQH